MISREEKHFKTAISSFTYKKCEKCNFRPLAGIEHVARVVARTLPLGGGGGGVMLDLPEFIQLNVFT